MPRGWPPDEEYAHDLLSGLYCSNECVMDAFHRGYADQPLEEDDGES